METNGDLGQKGRFISSFWLEDVSDFAVVRASRGRKRMVFPEEVKPLHPPVGEAGQPRIKKWLAQAFKWQARLQAEPGLTQTALAKDAGVSRVRVTQILNLTRLAPEIPGHILDLPPITAKRTAITENRLRSLIGIGNRKMQTETFLELLHRQSSRAEKVNSASDMAA